jgi:hypothetical protein
MYRLPVCFLCVINGTDAGSGPILVASTLTTRGEHVTWWWLDSLHTRGLGSKGENRWDTAGRRQHVRWGGCGLAEDAHPDQPGYA